MPRYCVWITVEGTPRYGVWHEFRDDDHAQAEGEVLVDRFNHNARSASGKVLSHTVSIEREDGRLIAKFGSFPMARTAA